MRKKNNDIMELAALKVINRLEVGPVELQPNRIVCPYKVYQNENENTNELIYKYEEDVFSPDDPAWCNLASMIAAQVAINYGLFCAEIMFRGSFSDSDQRFIHEMMENTSREIYVNKFLHENPFLTGVGQNLPVINAQKYTQANIIFENDNKLTGKVKWELWETDTNRHAVLSSGGKDSLLSFGLLNEINKEVHPVFINESGRHWFTAINAYRYFKDNIPNTARVWTNSDRVFNWMLQFFPFIRKDFQKIRADIYPIRLWTVAVFLFGALPLLRKRKIGRLIIGDEYDTTIRLNYKGITHYAGLYDQSRYFDNALSRYFMSKGWSIAQFSILRHLSELLIQKVLVERYHNLQEHQVSCHAAHKKNERIKPCGKCEKCRRIISMLTALDANPAHCGYLPEQIDKSLKDLSKKGIHQEQVGYKHLLYLLSSQNKVDLSTKIRKNLKPHTEILSVRFDSVKAPVNSIPADLRKPLYNIWAEHADYYMRKIGKEWLDYTPHFDRDIDLPFPFETSIKSAKSRSAILNKNNRDSREYLFAEMTWPEAEIRLTNTDVALLPIGSIEQHGPHLPLDTDAFDADYLAKQVAAACSDPKPFVLPLIPYGVSYHHNDFPGTISINNDTLSQLTYEIGMSAAHNGIKKLVIINGHGGNEPSLKFAAQMINRDAHIFVAVDTGETSDFDISDYIETKNDVHAGEFETSTSLAVRPHLVKMDKAVSEVPEFSNRYLNFTSKRGISWYAYTKKISKSGVMGDPARATAEKGRKMWQIMIAHLVAFIEDLKNLTLEEIYQKRY